VDATKIATALMGDSIATNMFLFGYAWQKGKIPLSLEAINRAIALNGVAVDSNRQSFAWGRIAASDMTLIENALPHPLKDDAPLDELEDIIRFRAEYLTEYQDQQLADKYMAAVQKIRDLETGLGVQDMALTKAVAQNYFKLLAIKDEYEVARLYTNGEFEKNLHRQFDGDFTIHFHMAPPLFAKKDSKGHLRKMEFGGWPIIMLRSGSGYHISHHQAQLLFIWSGTKTDSRAQAQLLFLISMMIFRFSIQTNGTKQLMQQ